VSYYDLRRAAAKLFAEEGAKVAFGMHHKVEKAKESVETIKKEGGEAIIIKADFS
jgi:NAD(P)-dependent dehydrogenase (short-subunit alcohol dehydrogenase family)